MVQQKLEICPIARFKSSSVAQGPILWA